MKLRILFVLIPLLFISGCEGLSGRSSERVDEQEFILLKVENYAGLLKLYRERLQQKEDPKIRFKVSEYYHKLEDYESSRHFLGPLLVSHPTSEAYLLESKNLLELGKREEALTAIDKAIALDKDNGQALNIKGVILAELGYFNEAINSFNQARETFLEDNIVMNNIAMVYILKEDYNKALEYLMPMYLRGDKSPKLIHNLVLSLIKTHDYVRAENVIRDENIPESLEKLIGALSDVQVAIKEATYEPKKDEVILAPVSNQAKNDEQSNSASSTASDNNSPFLIATGNTVPLDSAKADNAAIGQPLAQLNETSAPNSTSMVTAPEQSKSAVSTVLATSVPDSLLTSETSTPVAVTSVSNNSAEKVKLATVSPASKATISDVRMADNAKGSRLVIESDKEIKFNVLSSPTDNQLIIELNNFNPSNLLTNTGLYLKKKYVNSITFTASENDKMKMTLQFKRKMKAKVYRMGPEDHYKDRVVIDLTD